MISLLTYHLLRAFIIMAISITNTFKYSYQGVAPVLSFTPQVGRHMIMIMCTNGATPNFFDGGTGLNFTQLTLENKNSSPSTYVYLVDINPPQDEVPTTFTPDGGWQIDDLIMVIEVSGLESIYPVDRLQKGWDEYGGYIESYTGQTLLTRIADELMVASWSNSDNTSSISSGPTNGFSLLYSDVDSPAGSVVNKLFAATKISITKEAATSRIDTDAESMKSNTISTFRQQSTDGSQIRIVQQKSSNISGGVTEVVLDQAPTNGNTLFAVVFRQVPIEVDIGTITQPNATWQLDGAVASYFSAPYPAAGLFRSDPIGDGVSQSVTLNALFATTGKFTVFEFEGVYTESSPLDQYELYSAVAAPAGFRTSDPFPSALPQSDMLLLSVVVDDGSVGTGFSNAEGFSRLVAAQYAGIKGAAFSSVFNSKDQNDITFYYNGAAGYSGFLNSYLRKNTPVLVSQSLDVATDIVNPLGQETTIVGSVTPATISSVDLNANNRYYVCVSSKVKVADLAIVTGDISANGVALPGTQFEINTLKSASVDPGYQLYTASKVITYTAGDITLNYTSAGANSNYEQTFLTAIDLNSGSLIEGRDWIYAESISGTYPDPYIEDLTTSYSKVVRIDIFPEPNTKYVLIANVVSRIQTGGSLTNSNSNRIFNVTSGTQMTRFDSNMSSNGSDYQPSLMSMGLLSVTNEDRITIEVQSKADSPGWDIMYANIFAIKLDKFESYSAISDNVGSTANTSRYTSYDIDTSSSGFMGNVGGNINATGTINTDATGKMLVFCNYESKGPDSANDVNWDASFKVHSSRYSGTSRRSLYDTRDNVIDTQEWDNPNDLYDVIGPGDIIVGRNSDVTQSLSSFAITLNDVPESQTLDFYTTVCRGGKDVTQSKSVVVRRSLAVALPLGITPDQAQPDTGVTPGVTAKGPLSMTEKSEDQIVGESIDNLVQQFK